ncbi:MAG TPA: hypothetical protein VF587_03010 [Solirubrobacteraceae bacterium]|jgi:hypothetical protein
MGLRDIPRTAVGGYIKLARLPIDTGLKLVGRGGNGDAAKLAADRVDATAREAAGTVLGDEQLKTDGRKRHEATEQRQRAAKLRTQARHKSAQADEELNERQAAAEKRRKQAAQRASQRKETAQEAARKRQQRAAETERKRKQASEKAAAKLEEQISDEERRARLEQLETKTAALTEREEALTAADEAQRLEKAAATAKAARKS